MTLIALGINHNTAALELRERLAFAPTQVEPALLDALSHAGLNEIAILSTCNRTEIYCHSQGGREKLLSWFASTREMDPAQLESAYYCYDGLDAARHMMQVASGLDSLVLGEPQILGQMKSAYAVAREAGTLGGMLHDTFQRVFSIAKKVRSETAIGENPVSVAYAAVSLAQQIFSDLKQDTALLIGAGETIELVARHLVEQGIQHIIVANRTLGNASALAEQFDAEAMLLADIPEQLHRADIVISSTASQLPLLGKGAVEQALKARKHRPMFMVDIAVPRDIEPQVGDLPDVYLYTVDDLREVIDENKRSRERASEIAREIIDEGVLGYERELRALTSVNVIKAFRQHIGALREQELQKSIRALSAGAKPDEVLAQLAHNLANKFMHKPTAQAKQAGADGSKDVVKGLQILFDLELDQAEPEKIESENE